MAVRPSDSYPEHPVENEYAAPALRGPEIGAGAPSSPLEDRLRIFFASVAVLFGGLTLGNFTFGQLQERGTAYFILAACAAVFVTAVAYYRFEFCVLAYIVIGCVGLGGTPGLVNGVSSGTGKGLMLSQIGMAFLLFMWAVRGLSGRRVPRVRTPLDVALVLYVAVSVWSVVNGALFWDPAVARFYHDLRDPTGGRTVPLVNVVEILFRVLSVGALWLFASNLTDARWLRAASLLFVGVGGLELLARAHLMPNVFGGYSALLEIPLACTLFAWLLEGTGPANPAARRWLRFLAALVLLAIGVEIFFVGIRWISGWTALFMGLYYVAFLRSKKLFVGLACLGLILVLAFQPFLHHNVVQKVQTSGDTARFSMASAAVRYALLSPLGIGVGNYRAYNTFYGRADQWATSTFSSAHGFYSQALSETGFVGLALVVTWVLIGLVMLSRLYYRMPPGGPRVFLLGMAGMWAGIAAASTVGDYLIPTYHNGGVGSFGTTVHAWVGLGIAVAYARAYGLIPAPAEREAPAAPRASAAEYYPRRMSR